MALGIVGLVDAPLAGSVRQLSVQIERRWGVSTAGSAALPHVAFVHTDAGVAPGVDLAAIEARVGAIAAKLAPLEVRGDAWLTQLGHAPHPSLARAVIRTDELARVHADLVEAIVAGGSSAAADHEPDRWLPRFTLASGNVTLAQLGEISAWIFRRPPEPWVGVIDRLAIVEVPTGGPTNRAAGRTADAAAVVRSEFPLRRPSRPAALA